MRRRSSARSAPAKVDRGFQFGGLAERLYRRSMMITWLNYMAAIVRNQRQRPVPTPGTLVLKVNPRISENV